MGKKLQRTFRDRPLTREEVAVDAEDRRKIEQEFPPLVESTVGSEILTSEFDSSSQFWDLIRTQVAPQLERVTVPLFRIEQGAVKRDRSGVLYRIAEHYFILTAAHHLREIVGSNVPLFVDRMDGDSLPIPITESQFHATEVDGRDVAAIKLPSDVVQQLLTGKEFLTHRDVMLNDGDQESLYLFFGYPNAWSTNLSKKSFDSGPLIFVARPYKGEPSTRIDSKLHILLDVDPIAFNLNDKALTKLPKLKGISGCGIWRICEWSKDGIAQFHHDRVSLIAIQHRWSPRSKYVKGTRVGFVLGLIQDSYPDTSNAMKLVYPRN